MTTTHGASGATGQTNVFAPDLIDDPYPLYADILEAGSAEFTPPGRADVRMVVLGRHADVQAVLREPRFGRTTFRKQLDAVLGEGPLATVFGKWFLFQDP